MVTSTHRTFLATRHVAGLLALAGLSGLLVSTAATAPAEAAGRSVPTGVRVAAGGHYTTGLRVQWGQRTGVDRYEVRATARTGVRAASMAVSATRSTATRAVTVKGLRSGTWYDVAVRSVVNGRPGRWSPTLRTATRAAWPAAITGVTTRPGPGVGEMTVAWTSPRTQTTSFRIDTGLSMFSRTDANLPARGRNARSFVVPGSRTSVVLTAAQLAAAGAPVGSGNHLYLRVYAVSAGDAASHERAYPYLRSGSVRPAVAVGQVPLRVASFNVRTVLASDTGVRSWTRRVPYVAKTIVSRRPGVVALQELSPGAVTGTEERQTDSLMAALHRAGGASYAMVRNTSYVPGGTLMGSQGTRIVYDNARYRLLSDCGNTTLVDGHVKGFSSSCSFTLPLRPGDSEQYRRNVAYAQLEDRASHDRFWFVSAHLEHRTSEVAAERNSLEALRGAQAAAITARLAALDTDGSPVVFGGDLNTWQNTKASYAPHNALVRAGYYDTAAAASQVNLNYATFNDFATTVSPTALGYGARLDAIMVKGITGAVRFENVVNRVDPVRASDHNMIVADVLLPR